MRLNIRQTDWMMLVDCKNNVLRRTLGLQTSSRLILLTFSTMFLIWPAAGCNAPFWYAGPGLGGEEQSRKESKPQLIYFKTWDSTHHRNMGKKVFSNPEVRKELLETVNIELEFAFFEEQAKRYGVTKTQVCVVCTPTGRKVAAMYVNPVPSVPRFLEWLRRAKKEAKPSTTSGPAQSSKGSS